MTELIKIQNTMSSIQIAELTERAHKNVMRDIRNLLEQGVSRLNFELSSYEQPQPNGGTKTVPCYNVTKKGCLILASGYDAKLRERIIDRWEELETEKMMQDLPSYQIEDPIERAKKWINEAQVTKQLALENKQLTEENEHKTKRIEQQAETIEQQAEQIKADAPKVLFSKAVETSQRSCLVSELAKILKQNGIEMGQNRLFEWLRKKGYLCKHGQMYNQPTQMAMEKGLFEIKQTTINKPDGSILVSSTTKVTGRGQIYFVNKFLNKEVA